MANGRLRRALGIHPDLVSVLSRVALIHVTDVDVILVQLELVGGQYPAPRAPVSQGPRPPRWPYYLIWPPLRWNAGEDLANLQDARRSSVAFDRLTVNPPHISGPAKVVGIGQTTGLAITLGYAWAVRDAGEEIVTLLEGLDTDPVPLRQDSERCYQALVDNPLLQIFHRLRSSPEIVILQKLTHLSADLPGVLTGRGTWIPDSPADTRGACRREIQAFRAPTSGEQYSAKEQGHAYDRPPEPRIDEAQFHPTILRRNLTPPASPAQEPVRRYATTRS